MQHYVKIRCTEFCSLNSNFKAYLLAQNKPYARLYNVITLKQNRATYIESCFFHFDAMQQQRDENEKRNSEKKHRHYGLMDEKHIELEPFIVSSRSFLMFCCYCLQLLLSSPVVLPLQYFHMSKMQASKICSSNNTLQLLSGTFQKSQSQNLCMKVLKV